MEIRDHRAVAEMTLADLIREDQRLDEYLAENDDDDAASDRHDEVLDAITDRLEDFWKHDENTGRPVWNGAGLAAFLENLNPNDEDRELITYFLADQVIEADQEYEEAISTLYVPRDRNIKCKDIAAKLERYGIKVRRKAETRCYFIHYKGEGTYEFEWENPPGVKHSESREVLECVDAYWRGRTGKLDYFKVGSDYLKGRGGQETGADHILKALRETCGELLHGEEAAALLWSQKSTSPYWATTGHMQRVMMALEEDCIERMLKEQKAA
jgi:hypothetical protein